MANKDLYRLRAAELREMAAKLKFPQHVFTLVTMAAQYERLAEEGNNGGPELGPTPDEAARPN
jgi:hypothetical protein